MPAVQLRHSVRAIVLDERERVLLCRCVLPDAVVWIAPGGGIEAGETPRAALRREVREEVGLTVEGTPPHVWHQEIVAPGHAEGYDGVINDYFLVRTRAFQPDGALSDEELAAENLAGFRWWRLDEIDGYRGPDFFGPSGMAALLSALLTDGVPDRPLPVGP
ncbi:NUDIX domain-containing protein [Streptomyces spectabilis]|uniref:NUDIX domain-containing protein n=1 Tax=Streptomyces spectabilis TaxID=68270 RepID=A0A516R2Z0_STRST|nr:NUDIX domain-containing protein [Streptomyces spectabilis]QDQ10014.1 NUDIX domain-containing protein [Streptomyces spectabilis]